MEVEYRKDLRHNYMVITQEEAIQSEPYCIRLLEHQRLEGVLPVESRQMNNRQLYYYDITGRQSMNTLLAKSNLSCDKVRLIMNGILHTLDTAYEFLLPAEDFILKPDFIYLDVQSFAPSLCFLSGYHSESQEQMNSLLEYLMNKVDYNDKDAVLLVYQLYAVSREESFTTLQLLKVLDGTAEIGLSAVKRKDGRKEDIQKSIQLKEIPESIVQEPVSVEIPVMLEKVEREEEESYYPASVYLMTALCAVIGVLVLILGFTSGVLYNSYGERLDYSKVFALLLILLCVEGYLLQKIWNKKNKNTRIVTKSEYIDPRLGTEDTGLRLERRNPIRQARPQEELAFTSEHNASEGKELFGADEAKNLLQEEYHPTCLLSDLGTEPKEPQLYLRPVDVTGYQPILLTEFPFFIGKLKSNVDYCLDQKVISRYHAKITKEEEQYYITDLNSTNGTFVNGRMLQTYEKKDIQYGDEIAFANIRYEFDQQSSQPEGS